MQTPLYFAVKYKNINILNELLKISRCSVNLKDKENITPFILAVKNGTYKTRHKLIFYPNILDSSSIIKIFLENEDISKILLENGAISMALEEAIKNGNLDMVEDPKHIKYLKYAIQNYKCVLKRIKLFFRHIYPLHVAVEHKQLLVLKFLLTHESIKKDELKNMNEKHMDEKNIKEKNMTCLDLALEKAKTEEGYE